MAEAGAPRLVRVCSSAWGASARRLYLTVDDAARRIYVSRGSHVMVLDARPAMVPGSFELVVVSR